VNLTRITDPEEAVRKLYLASLALFPALAESGVVAEGLFTYLDLGTGAGFPGVPVAVAAPQLAATLIDARRKKVEFVAAASAEIGLGNIRAVHARGREFRGTFDLVTARAVASAAETIAEPASLLGGGGFLVVYKGPGLAEEEIAEGEEASRRYGLSFLGVSEVEVEDLTPKLLVYSAWSAGDEGEAAPE
jgi:16S rRNA (guanine527-N7)-methyltransferase